LPESLKNPYYYLTTLLFVLSLLSKPMAVTWPCVALAFGFLAIETLEVNLKRSFMKKYHGLLFP